MDRQKHAHGQTDTPRHNILGINDGKIFKIAKPIARTNQDVVAEKCIKNDRGDLAIDNSAKEAWKIATVDF